LEGHSKGDTVVIQSPEELSDIDVSRPIVLFSQTTKSVENFKQLVNSIKTNTKSVSFESHDTICRQVSNRIPHLTQFASKFDVIIFVGGTQSSNAKVLFNVCKKVNHLSYFVASPEDLKIEWFVQAEKVGICGATSTPPWLMALIKNRISEI
jgi:4-hydroxy-3-methylbut-2-en-1-yl diphosphate reductase